MHRLTLLSKYAACGLGRFCRIFMLKDCAREFAVFSIALFVLLPIRFCEAGPNKSHLDLLDFVKTDKSADRHQDEDYSDALQAAIIKLNDMAKQGKFSCLHIASGHYLVSRKLPSFSGPGCIVGDGADQTTIVLTSKFSGNLFEWSEAWSEQAPGPRIIGVGIKGSRNASEQNGLIFYDRNDEVYIEDVKIVDLPGRAFLAGARRHADVAFIRESQIKSLRLLDTGKPGVPSIELTSEGDERNDASNEIKMSQIDIYASRGPAFVIRNSAKRSIRNVNINQLRIEGAEDGHCACDLLDVGDRNFPGNVNNITFDNIELIDPYPAFAAVRLDAPEGIAPPYQITLQGLIGGGKPRGEGIRIDAGRSSFFRISAMHTEGANLVIGARVSEIFIDGGGQELCWSTKLSEGSSNAVRTPVVMQGALGGTPKMVSRSTSCR